MADGACHHERMRLSLLICAAVLAPAASAVDRIELNIGRIDAPEWQLREASVDWRNTGELRAQAAELRHAALPSRARISLRCAHLASPVLGCAAAQVKMSAAGLGWLGGTFAFRLTDATHWRLHGARVDGEIAYNSADGRLASEGLRLSLTGDAEQRGGPIALRLQLRAPSGQTYVEPVFVDLSEHPARVDTRLRWMPDGTLEIRELRVAQDGVGMVAASGSLDTAAAMQRHRIDVDADIVDAATASKLYLQPVLAATRLEKSSVAGGIRVRAAVHDGAVRLAELQLVDAALELPALGIAVAGLGGELHWRAQGAPLPSKLGWTGGTLGRLPVGAATLAFQAAGRDFALSAPLRLPVLDGAIAVEHLALRELGTDRLAAAFAAQIEPIDLRALCQSLGWPEFSGTLSGRLPSLHLRERRIDIDGTLSATAFDGAVEVRQLSVIDPFGVLPRLTADIRLRRLDLAAVTGAFDFGRITGRLDGDIEDLRLIGWEPVAMNARLYSTPGDRSRHRISQRAIDSISSIGGGPTGLLSRGVMRFFDDFAYDRIGWSCRLDNGICHMNGIGPSREGNGYVLVKGQGLPRIDVVGFSRQVSWPVFLSQLRSIGQSGPAEVR